MFALKHQYNNCNFATHRLNYCVYYGMSSVISTEIQKLIDLKLMSIVGSRIYFIQSRLYIECWDVSLKI